jgi:hypothetical protein
MTYKGILFIGLLSVGSFTQAEWFVSPKVSVGAMDYSTEWLEASFVTVSGGISLYNSSGWFFDFEAFSGSDDNVDRKEMTITLGKSLGGGFSVFSGIKDTGTTGEDIANDNWDFSAAGPFIGLSKNFRLGSSNSIAFSVAVAALDSDISLNGSKGNGGNRDDDDGGGGGGGGGGEDDNDGNGSVSEADALGTSIGVAWNSKVSDSLTTSIGLKSQSYDYDDLATVEEMTSAYLKLSYSL